MNFLAHFYFDGQRDSPYYNLGLVLPDLMGMVQRGWKIGKQSVFNFNNPQSQDLLKGIMRHLSMDDWFHQTKFFQKGYHDFKSILERASIQYPPYRGSFLAHIALELMVDRILVKQEPGMVSSFYEELAQIRANQLERFFYEAGVPFNENFHGFFREFVAKRYAFNYANDEAFIQALNNISKRVGQPTIESSLSENLKLFIPDLELTIFNSFEHLLESFQKD